MNKATAKSRNVFVPDNIFILITWLIFGNADDGPAPDTYMPNYPLWWRKVNWWFRNPVHNLFFYGFGFANFNTTSYGKDPTTPFVENGWNYSFTKPDDFNTFPSKYLYFPFISYRGGPVRFYIGWRPPEGAFGLKLQHNSKT